MISITATSVNEGLDALLKQEGEGFIYEKNNGACTYIREGEGDCIVGRYLVSVGVPVERLIEADQRLAGLRAPTLLHELSEEGVITYEARALDLLDVVQDYQDSRVPWGVAVRRARKEVGE